MTYRIYVHLSDTNIPYKKRLHNPTETNTNVVGIMSMWVIKNYFITTVPTLSILIIPLEFTLTNVNVLKTEFYNKEKIAYSSRKENESNRDRTAVT